MGGRKRRHDCSAAVLVVMVASLLTGCTTPPGAARLLAVVDGVLEHEEELVKEDASRDGEMLAQARAAMEAGFEADLRSQQQLDRDWVLSASRVYAAALVELGRHEAKLAEGRRVRLENLAVAREAQGRARQLLEQQDALLGAMGLDLWKLKGRLEEVKGDGHGS